MENWQAFAAGESNSLDQPGPAAAMLPGGEERARTLSLIDFLADYDARRNPPVYDIRTYDLFLLRDADLPQVPGIGLSPAAEDWLTVDFLDLPQRPEVPAELAELLGDSATMDPHVRPEIPAITQGAEQDEHGPAGPDPELLAAAQQWIAARREPFAARLAEGTAPKTPHRDLLQHRAV